MSVREGGCHCGAVRFKVRSSLEKVFVCNCSICTKKGFLHVIVPKGDFELITGERVLKLYQFNTKTARHYFCRHCGISSFYVPRSHPDGVDVNARCLDDFRPNELHLESFDGRNWEENIHRIEGYES